MPEAQGQGASAQQMPVAQAQAQRAPLAAAPGAPPQAPPPAAQREPQLGKGGPEKTASGAPSNGTDNSVGSGAENQDTGKRADSATADKGANGADSLESLEQEKQLAWKKEKRRKQNREAQRRRRDRLMNQHRQKQAELDGTTGGDLQGIGGPILNGQPAYMMMAGGGVGSRDLLAANMQPGGKDDQFGGLNMAMRYAGDLEAGAQLQSNMSMLQKQLSFGAGGMHAWANYNAAAAMHGNMLGQGLQAYGQMQQHANQSQQTQLGQQAHGQTHASHDQVAAGLHYPHARNTDSFNIGSSLNHLAMQGGGLHPGFPWDASNAHLLEMRGTNMAQLGSQASFGAAGRSLGALGVHGSLGMGNLGTSNSFAMAGNHAALGQNGISAHHSSLGMASAAAANLNSQNSFSMGMGYEVNPLLKSGSFAPPDFSAFLRQDSRNAQVRLVSVCCDFCR